MLMGRRTYEVARASGSGAYPSVTSYVFSRTLTEDPEPDVHLVRDDAATFVADLKGRPGKGIGVMGGGIPLFHPLPSEIALELERFEPIAGGCLYPLYRVRRRAPDASVGDAARASAAR
jgi:hypothetical protein